MLVRLLKVAGATLLYLGVHTLLASRPAKEAATRLLGERKRNALYRPFYNAQSVVGLVILGVYIGRQPSRTVWRAEGASLWLMRSAQASAGLYFLWGISTIGWGRFLGKPGVDALRAGCPHVPREPESQAAYLRSDGKMHAVGPFLTSRNAVNFAIVPLFWFNPYMADTGAVFCTLVTGYLVAGSYHSEARMRQLYGKPMEDYQKSGVPFFVPSVRPLLESAAAGP